MRILLTNDDGYRAPGINVAFEALLKAGYEVIVIAPERDSSGAAQSIIVYSPLSITQVSELVYFVSSTPADSIRLGLQAVYGSVSQYPDLIISGINMGENIGDDVLYSGTVGAAREGMVHGIPSLAFSTPGPEYTNLDSAARVVVDLVKKLEENATVLSKPFLWNVNIPNRPYDEIQGFEATELGRRQLHQPLKEQTTPKGNIIYWQGDSGCLGDATLGSDVDIYLKKEKISITPLGILATDYSQMPAINALTA